MRVTNGVAEEVDPDAARINSFDSSFLEIRMFSIGDGECVLVVSPERDAWLIDAGRGTRPAKNIALAGQIVQYLDDENLTLRAAIASHPHSDHSMAYTTLLTTPHPRVDRPLPFIRSDDPAWFKKPSVWLPLIRGAIATGAVETVIENRNIDLALGPLIKAMVFSDGKASNTAYTSLFVHLRFRDATILFTGDAYKEYEKRMLAEFGAGFFESDVLKVTHHGSKGGTDKDVLEKIDPGFAFASTGGKDDDKHGMSTKARTTLVDQGVMIFETFQDENKNRDGRDIVIQTDGNPFDGTGVLYKVERVPAKF
ncbi:MAG: MBL fold metallo-hydrolase [Armatimonadetes bacterium]|nr:MBL fold metallo-hydrolase [Armatimonadota bacterium]